jgi:hypothetical protein
MRPALWLAVLRDCDVAGGCLLARGLLSPPALWRRQTWDGIETRGVTEAEDRVMAVVGSAPCGLTLAV